MNGKLLAKVGTAILAGAVAVVEALHGTIDADEIKLRAIRAIEANKQALADAEALEEQIFRGRDGASG